MAKLRCKKNKIQEEEEEEEEEEMTFSFKTDWPKPWVLPLASSSRKERNVTSRCQEINRLRLVRHT